MSGLFPPLEPYEAGLLDVGDGHRLYWETSGNPEGLTVATLHGGPGSGCTSSGRRLFDPGRYRIVQFDQRGAGNSQPRVDARSDLDTNTTTHLVADLERLREHFGVERWVLRGVSWGVTLGLTYAEAYPHRVVALVFNSVTLTRPPDIHWLYHEAGRFYPEAWQRFRAGAPDSAQDGNLVAAYHHLLNGQPDEGVRQRAADDWCAWEDAVSPLPDGQRNRRYDDPRFRMTFARIVSHYFHHDAWLEPNQLLRDANRLAGIPGVLIQGRLDVAGPPDTAWQLAQAWPDAQLRMVPGGHTGGDEMTGAIVDATEQFAGLA